ncbi:MAG: carboxypeptidase regulatory-like domain-containing protein [Myxococcaceae bacterium]|nr:carboxypeptidase regulatory-like domain-containing protein [Myxococcaceae bacterium]
MPVRRLALAALALPSLAFAAPDVAFRDSAQKALDFLGQDTARWQKSNSCYGCHVQAVTLEGLSVGTHNQYRVPQPVMDEVLRGILHTPGGSRTPGGLTHSGFPRTAKTFGASAFARYDALVNGKLTDDLLRLAKDLLAFQEPSGEVRGDHQSYPVTTGPMQATFQAAQTWRQAYARTADDAWLPPLRQAEKYMNAQARAWGENPSNVYLQDLNYVTMGLLIAGASPSEPHVARLVKHLESRQLKDGGWGFGGASDAFATGQTVYALKLAGRTEADSSVRKGLGWLVEHQAKDGGWGHGGSGRAEAMWGVLGLVSVDVVSIAVKGVTDSEHVTPTMPLSIEAKDNSGAEVKTVEVLVDDLPAKKVNGGALSFSWDTTALKTGKHTLDVVATNAKGQTSRRRFEVYAGDLFLLELGSRFTNEGTQLTLRNIAPETTKGAVTLEVRSAEKGAGGQVVFTQKQASGHGAMAFVFGGKGHDGKALATGRYEAKVAFVDDQGVARQTETLVFVHDTPEAQRARYAEVEGRLDLSRDGSGAANAEVELVDDQGHVVQRSVSNAAGQYRFKSVDSGKYKVRVKKDGFRAAEAPVEAKAGAAPAAAPVSLH